MVPLCLLLIVARAAAGEPGPEPPTVEQAAEAVLAARQAGSAPRLKRLAGEDEPDPWLVADELCRRGEHDAAEAFARAAPRPAVAKLAAYVDARVGKGTEEKERSALAKATEALRTSAWERAVESITGVDASPDSVVGIRLAGARARALGRLQRHEDAARLWRKAGRDARAIGWLRRASLALGHAGEAAMEATKRRPASTALALAVESWREAIEVRRALGDRAGTARALYGLGITHDRAGRYAEALAVLEKSRNLAKKLDDRGRLLSYVLGSIGYVHAHKGDAQASLQLMQESLAIKLRNDDKPAASNTLRYMGWMYGVLGRKEEALAAYERRLDLARKMGHVPTLADALRLVGSARLTLGKPDAGLSILEEALEQFRTLGRHSDVAGTLGLIAKACRSLRRNEQALERIDAGLRVAEEDDPERTWLAWGALYDARGGVLRALGRTAEAEAEFHRAHEAYLAQAGTRTNAALALANVALVQADQGRLGEAVETAARGVRLARELGDPRTLGLALERLGGIFRMRGEHAASLRYREEALQHLANAKDRQAWAETRGSMALTYMFMGNYEKALAYARQAMEIQQQMGNVIRASGKRQTLALVYYRMGTYARALQEFEALLAEIRSQKRPIPGTVLNDLAGVYSRIGDEAKALALYRQALEAMEAEGDAYHAATALGNVGNVLAEMGRTDEAVKVLEAALEKHEAMGKPGRHRRNAERAGRRACAQGRPRARTRNLRARSRVHGEARSAFPRDGRLDTDRPHAAQARTAGSGPEDPGTGGTTRAPDALRHAARRGVARARSAAPRPR